MAVVGLVFSVLTWSAGASLGVWVQQARLQNAHEHLKGAKLAYDDLLAEIGVYQRKVVSITGHLKRNQVDLLRKLAREDAARSRKAVASGISPQGAGLAVIESESRDAMHAHLKQLDSELADIEGLSRLLEGSVQSVQDDIAAVEAERAEVYEARTLLKRRVGRLEQALAKDATTFQQNLDKLESRNQHAGATIAKLSGDVTAAKIEYDRLMGVRAVLENKIKLQERAVGAALERGDGLADNLRYLLAGLSDAVGEADENGPADGSLRSRSETLLNRLNHLHAAQSDIFENLKLRTAGSIEDAERIIAMTGLKVAKVLDGVDSGNVGPGENLGQGGPFIAALPNSPIADGFAGNLIGLDKGLHRSERLRHVLGSLPLISPVDSYSIASSYGRRTDPFTKKRAMHKGLDLAARKNTPVRATAPGVVISAGWNGKYGRMVEIRHGNGFKSRYGHLRKTLVKKGQQVDHRQKIGLLGSTGRSTGPHVHYEVWFNDRVMNPIKFIKAGKHVFKE
jgi:murein DD-endopeptidase MepM/ murein hydrolase activator NlpD